MKILVRLLTILRLISKHILRFAQDDNCILLAGCACHPEERSDEGPNGYFCLTNVIPSLRGSRKLSNLGFSLNILFNC